MIWDPKIEHRMSNATLDEFSSEVLSILQDELKNVDETRLQITPELRLSYFNPFLFDSNEKFTKYTFDAIIYRKVGWAPTGLDQIDDIERWFHEGTESVEIPIAVIEFTKEQLLSSKNAVNHVALKDISKFDPLLPMRIRYAPMGSSSPPFEEDEGVVYSQVHLLDQRQVQRSIVEPLQTHIAKYSDEDLLETFELEDKVQRSDPEIFYHFNDVLWAYRHERNNILVILLSVYFENHVKETLEAYLEKAKENPHASAFYDDDWGFDRCLNGCRSFGLLEEDAYNTIDKIKDARNDYAHNIESFDESYTTDAEEDGIIEEGILLYEELIGVKKSILDE